MAAEVLTLHVWRLDEVRIVFMNPDADGKNTEWRGSSVDLFEHLLDEQPAGWT